MESYNMPKGTRGKGTPRFRTFVRLDHFGWEEPDAIIWSEAKGQYWVTVMGRRMWVAEKDVIHQYELDLE